MNYLFVGGCPRSGTTAMLELLNADPRIALGKERFKFSPVVRKSHFEPEYFLNPTADDTNLTDQDFYDALREKYVSDELQYRGDKTPAYFRRMSALLKQFPDCKLIMMLRDPVRVADSFVRRAQNPTPAWPAEKDHRDAVRQWNDSLRLIKRVATSKKRNQIFVVRYESFFCGDPGYLAALYEFLELPITRANFETLAATSAQWNKLRRKPLMLSDEQLEFISKHCDRAMERRVNHISMRSIIPNLKLSSEKLKDAASLRRFGHLVVRARNEQLRQVIREMDRQRKVFRRESAQALADSKLIGGLRSIGHDLAQLDERLSSDGQESGGDVSQAENSALRAEILAMAERVDALLGESASDKSGT